jgi:hypothetical protein
MVHLFTTVRLYNYYRLFQPLFNQHKLITLREIQEIQPFRRESAARSSSEGSKSVRKPRQLRVSKQRDVV